VARVALLHGFAGDPHAWDDAIAAWPPGDELVALALPGHGGGDVRGDWNANVELVADAVAAAGAEVVIGYSLGGRVALGLLATDRIRRGVLIGVHPGLTDEERPARRDHDARWAELLRGRGIAAFAEAWQRQPLFASQARVAPERLAARRDRRLGLDAEQLAHALESLGLAAMPDYRAHAGRATLVAGADDAKFLDVARALGLPCVAIDGSGHDPTLEQPERLASVLAGLVRRLEQRA
jgi:2-succinyl-6-hydroxy-2,4-cyclohexadiene-1-carboxylate synthase